MEYWWNDTDRGLPKYSGKNRTSAIFFTINLTWTDPESNPGLRGEKPVTNPSAMARPLKTKINLKTQSVPRSKHTSFRLYKPVS